MKILHFILTPVFAALLAACTDTQSTSGNNQFVAQKKLTPEEKLAKLQQDATQGNADAQFALGFLYVGGEGPIDTLGEARYQRPERNLLYDANIEGIRSKDTTKAMEWWQKAAAQGNSYAQFNLGAMYANGEGVPKDATKAMDWWQKAAAQGNASAQLNLGKMYVTSKDVTKAMEWWQKAAAQGNAGAQYALGGRYALGVGGVPKDAAKAAEWLLKAATQGNVPAQYHLGLMYDNGEGVPKNAAKAAEWWQKAAAQGDAGAQYALGLMYYTGEGISRNLVLAYAWLNLSAAVKTRVDEDGEKGKFTNFMNETLEATRAEYRDRIERILTPTQRTEGQYLASNWKKGSILQAEKNITQDASITGGTPKRQGTATGFIVSPSGRALTNHHVIEDCNEVRVAGQDGTIKVITSDTTNDLALLQIPGKTDAAIVTDDTAKLRQGEDVVVYGYPLNFVLSPDGNLTPGIVSALSGLGNNTNQIQITAPIQPGSSGSPVLDKKGNVVGMVSMKLSDSKMAKATGQVGQNVNFAVNGQTVKAFLDANKVPYKTGGGFFSREKSNADIAEDARKWTVAIECWK